MQNTDLTARALLVFAALTWASNVVVGRYLRVDVDPDILNLMRWAFSALALLPFTAHQVVRHRQQFRRHWLLYLACGIIGLALFQTVIYSALQWTNAAHVGVALALSPIVALIAGQRGRNRAQICRSWLGFGISFSGVVVVLMNGAGWQFDLGGGTLLGGLLAVFGGGLWGVYGVLSARLPRDVPPFASLTVLCSVAALVSLVPVLVHVQSGLALRVNATAVLGGAYLALAATIAGLAAFNFGIARIGAAAGAQFVHFTPIFTVILAALVLGETVTLRDVAGFCLIAAGIYVSFRPQFGKAASLS